MKTVVIHQPDFCSYLGFFHRLLHADLYIALDHVQFVNGTSRAWTHRDKIKTPTGDKWLTLSVKKSPRDTPINEIELSADANWRNNNLRLLESNYARAPYYDEIMPKLVQLYSMSFENLVELNMSSIELLMDLLDVRIPWVLSSSLKPMGSKNELLVDVLQKVNATRYLSGVGAKAYFEPFPFEEAEIEVVWQEFNHPVYSQLHGKFIPYLSSIDLLFNCGIEKSREILRGC